jgi:hypothetical protein
MSGRSTAKTAEDEVEQVTRAMLDAVDRITHATRDPACAQAARIAVGAALLSESMTADEVASAINDTGRARGSWQLVRVQ